MELDEHTIDELFEANCEVCGAQLTPVEIHDGREAGRPFLCSVHAAEELPAVDPEFVGEPGSADAVPAGTEDGP
jgi:hypothetical protein